MEAQEIIACLEELNRRRIKPATQFFVEEIFES
jgi:hypothetical protein